MIFSLIRQSIRHHSKNKLYTIINIFGLAVGMACFALLTLLVMDEKSHDAYHKDKELIYQVYTHFEENPDNEPDGRLMAPAGPYLAEAIPEIASYTRFKASGNLLARVNGNRVIVPRLYATDKATMDYFGLEFIGQKTASVGLEKNEILLSRSAAEKLYGEAEDAVGEVFEIPDFEQFIVKGVFEDLPSQTHLAFDYLISFEHTAELSLFETGYKFNFVGWSLNGYPTYVKLTEPLKDPQLLAQKIQEALTPHVGKRVVNLVPLDQIYFSEWNDGFFKPEGDDSYLNLYLLIGLVLLIVAVVNYTNLSTARFSKRAREVGVRKAIGGYRSQLMWQFLAESLTLTVVSSVLAICFFELAIPGFNAYMHKEIFIDYASPWTYLIFGAFTLTVGVIAGIYPAFFLSAFSPRQGLSKNLDGKGGGLFRKMLVGFQFATCLALMVVAAIVYHQYGYMSVLSPGLNSEQLVILPMKDKNLQKSYAGFKNELLTNPRVKGVSGASIDLFSSEYIIKTDVEGQEDMLVTWARVERNFFDLMEIEKDQGLLFSEQTASESKRSVIINQSVISATGWEQPLEQQLLEAPVDGVVKDFMYGSAREIIAPLMVTEGEPGDFEFAYVRIDGNIAETLETIEAIFDGFSVDHPFEYSFLDDEFAAKYESERRLGEAFGAFSLLTVFIAGLGVLGLSIFIAETRTKEIGIRKVLGAGVERIIWLLNGGITRLILGVALIVMPAVYYLMDHWLQDFAYRIELSFAYFFLPLLSLIVVVWGILFYQSLKCANLNPVEALRSE